MTATTSTTSTTSTIAMPRLRAGLGRISPAGCGGRGRLVVAMGAVIVFWPGSSTVT